MGQEKLAVLCHSQSLYHNATVRVQGRRVRIPRNARPGSRGSLLHLHDLTPGKVARIIAATFAALLALGTFPLSLPVATVAPGRAPFLDCLFTATSALTVTGLTTQDTATYWTPFGKVVVISLIQIGGLGVMTFTTLLGLILTRKVGMAMRVLATAETKSTGSTAAVVGRVALITLIVEGLAAVILTLRFLLHEGYSPGKAIAHGVFHAISAFNNAGFALYSDNVMGFQDDPWILLTLATCVILGGLGFPVIVELVRHLRFPRRWSMTTRLMVVLTPVLLVGGTVFLLILEWSNPATLGPMSVPEKTLNAFFQSTITRTAGFNSIDISSMHSVSWLGMDILMFIGGGPASTASGLKVTTFGVLFFIALTEIRGGQAVPVMGKQLSRSVQRGAITVLVLAVTVVMGGTMLVMLADPSLSLDRVLVECVSAFGTVGLSTGITATLPPMAKYVLIVMMFAGRLGVVTIAAAMAFHSKPSRFELPKERPLIG